MSDDPKPDPAPEPDPTPDPAPDPTPDPAPEPFDEERAMALITKLRGEVKEAKKGSKRADEAEARLKEIEDANKSEEDKRAERLAEYETREKEWEREKRDTALRLAVYGKRDEVGIADVDLALAAIPQLGLEVEYDDKTGQPSNLDEVLTELLEKKPLLRGTPTRKPAGTINSGDGNQGGATPSLTADELEEAKRAGMTPERYAAFKNVTTYEDYQALRAAEAKT